MKCFEPTYYAKNIYQIPLSFYKENGIRALFLDLDNTLDAFDALVPSSEAKELIAKLQKIGLKIFIVSNNHEERVKKYADELGVDYSFHSLKPFAFRLNKFIKKHNLNKQEILMVGDQTVTDIKCSNALKVRGCLVDKLVDRDQPTTTFNRFFDKKIRKKLENKGILKEREINYGN
jgi:uncharacterized protein